MIANPSLNDAFATVDGAYGRRRGPGWAVSLVLHGLLAFFLIRQLTALPADAPVVPVEVVHIASGERWAFGCHNWIDKKVGWCRVLPAVRQQ